MADGDTITVRHEGITTRVRLAQIDCPEIRHGRRSGQPFGNAAKRFTLKAAAGKVVTVKGDKTDRYGRTIGEVILPDGTDLNRELVRVGLAWWYRHYSHDPPLGKLEQRARTAHLGLWSQPHPKPPWQYRHERRRRHH